MVQQHRLTSRQHYLVLAGLSQLTFDTYTSAFRSVNDKMPHYRNYGNSRGSWSLGTLTRKRPSLELEGDERLFSENAFGFWPHIPPLSSLDVWLLTEVSATRLPL